MSLQTGRQLIALGQPRRQIIPVLAVPVRRSFAITFTVATVIATLALVVAVVVLVVTFTFSVSIALRSEANAGRQRQNCHPEDVKQSLRTHTFPPDCEYQLSSHIVCRKLLWSMSPIPYFFKSS